MSEQVEPIPAGFQTITPYLVVHDAPAAIAFYAAAFGAVEHSRLTDEGGRSVRHAELAIGTSRLFITDIPLAPETQIPGDSDTCPVWLYLYLNNPDEIFNRAMAAGAEMVSPMGDQTWGDRYGCVRDPFGYRWGIASRTENVGADEVARRMQEAVADD